MNNNHLILNANPIVAFLQKPAAEFTKADIIDYMVKNDIRMVNFMYPAGDGRLKTLNFVINDLCYLDTILTCGERVDGSSLFSFIQAGSSDLYLEENFGIKLTEDETAYIFSRNSPAKPHLAQVLVDRGIAATISDAITGYINKCHVEGLRISSREAVEYVHRAGGAAVWAHPLGGEGETPLTEGRFTSRLRYLMACGIDGMECYYSRYDAAKREILLNTAEREDLFISGGSDFHGSVKDIPLGRLDKDDRCIRPEKLTILEHPAIAGLMEGYKRGG